MNDTYKIIIDKDGINHVKVFKSSGNGYTNDWNFPLECDEEPIVFSDFYTESKFIVMNWDGWIRVYDAASKTRLAEIKLHGKIDSQAVLSLDKSTLYVTLRNESNQIMLTMITLDSFTINSLELPDIYKNQLAIRKDGDLIFYKHDYERIDGNKIFKHFYSVLNMTSYDVMQYEIPNAPQFSFGNFIPVIDIENNRCIMPAYEDVQTKTIDTGEKVFEFRIALYDLNTFENTLVSVRDFPINQLGCSEYDCNNMAEIFLGTDRDDDYTDQLSEYYQNLTSIKIVSDGFWLCWRGGIIRKIHTDGSMSPLLVTASIPNNSAKGMFNLPYFHSHLYDIDNSRIVLSEELDLYKAEMPTIENADFNTPIPLHFEKISREELFNASFSNEQVEEIELRAYVQIKVTDLSTKKGIEEALLQLTTIVSDLKAAGIDSTLQFICIDSSKKMIHEPAFFEQAIQHSPENVHTLIKTLLQHSKIKYIYRNPCETVLCHAVYELAKQKNDAYLKTIIHYLAAIDMDHDVFNRENLIPLLEETYTYKVLAKKIKPISKEFAEWYECYCEEMHEE